VADSKPKSTEGAQRTWAIRKADYGSVELNDSLREGWEPVVEPIERGDGRGGRWTEPVVIVMLRKVVVDG
jgi:hypothetical protein